MSKPLHSMTDQISEWYRRNPLYVILGVAFIARLLAALFSGGYIASDDHFLVVHIAWKWLNGDPAWLTDPNYSGHSILYPGAHFLFFKLCHAIGLTDTLVMMTLVRILHVFWSLPVIWVGYRLVETLTDRKFANLAGWLLALLWIAPNFSVRQLPEVVSSVPLLLSLAMAERIGQDRNPKRWIAAGIFLGISFTLRYQAGFCGVGAFAALLLTRRYTAALWFTVGSLIGTIPLGLADWFAFGTPYANPVRYFLYNAGAVGDYITRPWYNYLLLILGVFLPPFSFLLLIGFFKSWRKVPLMFGATIVFLAIHSAIPNKQERFIATILPELIILGVVGIYYWLRSERWKLSPRFLRGSLIAFWILNLPVMTIVLFTYNKHAQIVSLAALQHEPGVTGAILDQREKGFLAPWFYLGDAWGKSKYFVEVKNDENFQSVCNDLKLNAARPNYLIIYLDKNREQRKQQWLQYCQSLQEMKRIPPSFVDEILHKMNPKYNPSFDAVIYQIKYPTP